MSSALTNATHAVIVFLPLVGYHWYSESFESALLVYAAIITHTLLQITWEVKYE